jgi:DNA repair exonuclease SbcCD nuclease subunit
VRAIVFSDVHLESGGHLGGVDTDYENTRLRDAERILGEIVAAPHDVLIFGGDMGRTAAPRPVAYRILQRALAASAAPTILVMGNHDWTGSRAHTGLHVVAEGLPNAKVATTPVIVDAGELQVGVIPWTPPTRLFDAARHSPSEMHRAVSERLVGVSHALAKKLDPGRPSLLVLHWMLSGGTLATGTSVLEVGEPVVPVDDLEGGGWDAIIAGHNHVMQQVGSRSWHTGPPLRTGFGETDVPTGYLAVDWADGEAVVGAEAEVTHVPTTDRRLVRLSEDHLTADWHLMPSVNVRDAVVKIKLAVSEEQARVLNADGQRVQRDLKAALRERGASKVIGPELSVERTRRVRSDLALDVDPAKALDEWIAGQEINDKLAGRVRRGAKEVMG